MLFRFRSRELNPRLCSGLSGAEIGRLQRSRRFGINTRCQEVGVPCSRNGTRTLPAMNAKPLNPGTSKLLHQDAACLMTAYAHGAHATHEVSPDRGDQQPLHPNSPIQATRKGNRPFSRGATNFVQQPLQCLRATSAAGQQGGHSLYYKVGVSLHLVAVRASRKSPPDQKSETVGYRRREGKSHAVR